MNTYETKIQKFIVAPQQGTLTQVVKAVEIVVTAQSALGTHTGESIMVHLAEPDSEQFVPVDQITEQLTWSWINSQVNWDQIHADLDAAIAHEENPPVVHMQPPFVTN